MAVPTPRLTNTAVARNQERGGGGREGAAARPTQVPDPLWPQLALAVAQLAESAYVGSTVDGSRVRAVQSACHKSGVERRGG